MQISKMKTFLLKITILIAILLIGDYVFGCAMGYVVNNIVIGGQGRDNYICNISTDDILIFGSSRAVHHYNTQMFEDSLKLSCYNCGEDGNGIILSYSRLKMIEERKVPQIIILDITPEFDYLRNDNHIYLGWLKARYERDGIKDVFESIDPKEKLKMISQMYRYNSKFLQNIVVFLTSLSTDTGIKGFRPLEGDLDTMKIKKDANRYYDFEIDDLKIDYINKFISLSSSSQLYFVVSPTWYGMEPAIMSTIKEICTNNNIKLLDYSNSPSFVHVDRFFKDGTHLNAKGADEFSKCIIADISKFKTSY